LKWYYNNFDFNKSKGVTWINFDNAIEFARLVAGMDDADLFNDIYDSYNMFFTNGHYGGNDSIFYNTDYLEILLDHDHLFNSMFEIKRYELELGHIGRRKKQVDSVTYYSINPIINNCLRYSLQHLDKYKRRAKDILNFAIRYNKRISDEIAGDDCYICNELGGIKSLSDNDYYNLIIFVDVEINDSDIKELVDRLLNFKKF
jgi:hypothetical protein